LRVNLVRRAYVAPGELTPEEGFNGADIVAQFNGGIGTPTCIPGSSWYYGLDNRAPSGTIDFLNTFMHELVCAATVRNP
jgi:hypothetical protein